MRSIALAVMLSVVPALAQPILPQRFDDTITINVVDVPVYVERFGVPVRGLTRDDFTLFVDGKPHPIEYFDVIDEGVAAEAAPDAPADLKRRRLIVLLFDLSASPYSLQRAREAAMKYVAEGVAGDTFAVATVGRSDLRFIAAFTTDRVAVQRAIATLAPSASRDPFRVATLDDERARWAGTLGGAEAGLGAFSDIWGDDIAPGGMGVSSAAENAAAFERTAQEMEALEEESLSIGFVESLSALADRLAPLEGVKQVVLLSERQSGRDGQGPVMQRTTRLHARYRAAGVILNAVDIHPPRVPSGAAISSTPDGRTRAQSALASEFLYSLALDTGGVVTSSLPQLLERNRHAYVIGFRAPEGAARESIRVEVKNLPRLTDVRYRKSYDLRAAKSADQGLFLADTLLNDIPQNGVTLGLAVKGTQVTASIPGVELLSYASGRPLPLEVFFYVFNEEGRPFSWNVAQIAVDLEKGRDFLSAHPYTMRQDLVLQPGRYVVKALVRVAGTDRVGFQRAPLVVQ
ncbi:MAG TPA: VWA domain-containing protein [Thermoanaerobaculia bacterium]